jgi:hypothetical protein
LDLAIVVLLVIYAVASIVSLWQSPYLLALLLLPAPLVLVARLGRSGLALAATGAILGPATEIACVYGGLWIYAETGGLPFVPPWLIVIWACFPTALWLIVRSLLGSIPASKRGTLPLALLGIAVEVVLFVALSKNTPLVIIAGLILAAAVLVIRWEKSTIILMAAGAVLGPVCEALPVAQGAWSYTMPQVLGMPIWLPLAYALFAALVSFASWSVAASHQGKIRTAR